MGARGRHRRGQAGLRERFARCAHQAAGLARHRRRGNRAGGERRSARHSRAGLDPGPDAAGTCAELLVAARQGRLSHRPPDRRHARLPRARALPHRSGELAREPRRALRPDSRRSGARHLAETPAECRPHPGRLARARAGRGGNDAQSHARGRRARELEALISRAPGQRQRAGAGAEPDCRRHRVSESDRAAPAAVGPLRGRRHRRARRVSGRVSRAGCRVAAAREDLRRRRRIRRGRLSSCHRRGCRLRRGPAHQGGCGRDRALEQRPHAGARAQFPRRFGERSAEFLPVCAAAGG